MTRGNHEIERGDASTRRLLVLALLLLGLCTPQALARPDGAGSTRVVTPIDAGWRHLREDRAGSERPELDDKAWAAVTLPHTYNGADGEDGGSYYRGGAWYRRVLDLAAVPTGRRAYLQFDGAALAADVYVNGRRVGRHEGGHARFRVDVTDALRPGRNLVAVRTDNSALPTVAPLGGDFTIFGGLYRHVLLVETDAVHIDLIDEGGPGAHLVTRTLTRDRAELEARVRVRNDAAVAADAEVTATVRDAAGRVVASASRPARLAAGQVESLSLPLAIARPRRWHGREDPYLYRVTAEVRTREGSDGVELPLGLRTARFDPQRGFLLNERPYPLYGVNLFHSGRPGRGLAATDAEVVADLQTVDELGATAVRFVHFQHPEIAYAEADRRGLLVWTEIGLNGAIGAGAAFDANVSAQMRELVRQNRHHPSIMLWGLGNEVYSTSPEVTRVLRLLHGVAKQEDPTRPTVYAHCCQSDDDPKAQVSDVIAFNRYFGWYPDQKGSIGAWADGYHQAHPDRAMIVGEYGAGGSIRHQQLPPPEVNVPAGGWHPEQAQTRFHETSWRQLSTRRYLGGAFVWVGFDLASDGRAEGDRPGINDKGLVTYDRAVRKDAFYFYQAQWSKRPMVHIADRRLERRTEPLVTVRAFSNGRRASLVVNGSRIASAAVVDGVATWPGVRLSPGPNRLEVTARVGSEKVTDAVEWELAPASRILAEAR